MVITSNDRFGREAGLVPQEKLTALDVSVVGVGAIGREVALQLAALGVRKLRLVDFDVVELTNVTTQGYYQADVGFSKVEATAGAIRQIDTAIELSLIQDRFRAKVPCGDVVFCCTDSIGSCKAIWQMVGQRLEFWCDGRMLGEVMRILCVASQREREHYAQSLFEPSDCASRHLHDAVRDLHGVAGGRADAQPIRPLAAGLARRQRRLPQLTGHGARRYLTNWCCDLPPVREEVSMMECFVALGVLGLICWAGYRFGKNIGSRKGYAVGCSHRLRRF